VIDLFGSLALGDIASAFGNSARIGVGSDPIVVLSDSLNSSTRHPVKAVPANRRHVPSARRVVRPGISANCRCGAVAEFQMLLKGIARWQAANAAGTRRKMVLVRIGYVRSADTR